MLAKSLFRCALALLLTVATTSALHAQGRGMGMMGMGVSPLRIVGNEAVQKELKVTEAQADKLTDFVADYSDESREQFTNSGIDFQALRGLEGAEREKRMAEVQVKMAELSKNLNDKYRPKLKEILKEEQIKRLQEIAIQAAGSAAFQDSDVKKELALTKEQDDKLAAVNKASGEKMRELFSGGGGGDREAAMKKMAELRAETNKEALAVLTKEQQEKFDKLKGKEFDVSSLRMGGRRRPSNN